MAFTGNFITIVGLAKIVLPSRTIRLCDGGIVTWAATGETYTGADAVYGAIGGMDVPQESLGNEAPGGRLTLLPPSITGASDLFAANAQGSSVKFWIGEVNTATGAITGTPQLMFDGFVDTMLITASRSGRTVEIDFMSAAERLFYVAEGNVLSPRYQKALFPGELGLDYASNAQTSVAWGVAGEQRGSAFSSSIFSIIARSPLVTGNAT